MEKRDDFNDALLADGNGKAELGRDDDVPKEDTNKTKSFLKKWKSRFGTAVVGLLSEDWLYLVILGVLMGVLSFIIDICISKLRYAHFHIFYETNYIHWTLQYFCWIIFSLVLVLVSATLCHFVAPQAVGSGIPELKIILRGVALKEYLTLRTLIIKFLGLVLALGSGLPLGKEGPFVHLASMLARLLSKMVASFQSIYENESRSSEMLAAACAVGVASTYGAPVGGVLFSIEVTSVFFPLRNYWRGFLSTVCSAVVFRLLTVWFREEETVVAFSRTSFPSDYPFDPKELVVFALIGIACGFMGALFVWFHRKYVQLVLQNRRVKLIMSKNYLIYPAFITVLIIALKCPLGFGKFFAGGLTPREALGTLFYNFSWIDPGANNTGRLEFWTKGTYSIFAVLSLYTINMFWMTAIAITLPIPCGVFIPVFVTGAAFGRIIGEIMYIIFPYGVRTGGIVTKIVPGAYALIAATALSGAVTHAISTSVIVMEITGQILYILPATLAVLLAIAVCARLQPSIYDSIIRLKKLPYLPRILPTSSAVHRIYVEDIMVRDVKFLSLNSTYREIQDLLIAMPKLKSFPLVDRSSSAVLLGSIRRSQLESLLNEQVGEDTRRQEALRLRTDKLKSSGTRRSDDFVPVVLRKESRFQVRRVSSLDLLNEIPTRRKVGQQPPQLDTILATPTTSPIDFFDYEAQTTATHHTMAGRNILHTMQAFGNYIHSLPHKLRMSLRRGEPSQLQHLYDLTQTERLDWEAKRLMERAHLERIAIDPAPFQLVEKTSLYKVHALFWLLGLSRAYVTCLGRLVGVVALKELRSALERAQPSTDPSKKRRRKATFDPNMRFSPANNNSTVWRSTGKPQWLKRPSAYSRQNSTAPSIGLIPGQADIINVSIPSLSKKSSDSSLYSNQIPDRDEETTARETAMLQKLIALSQCADSEDDERDTSNSNIDLESSSFVTAVSLERDS